MKKVLLVDTNRATYPIYDELCQLGYEVWVVGINPAEPLAKISEKYVELDYSDVNKLSEFIEKHSFEYVVPGCTDLSYKVCSEINNQRYPGIDSPETTYIINDKQQFRMLARELGISVPTVFSFNEAVAFKSIIIKPVDSFSGRGISVINNPTVEEVKSGLNKAVSNSVDNKAIIEEFVEGQLYSFSCFIEDMEIVTDFIVQEDCSTSPYAVDTSRLVDDFPELLRDSLRSDVTKIANRLSLVDGLVHIQFIMNKDNYWLIEMTRRCPGDIYSLLIEFSTGYPYAASYAAPFIGKKACKVYENNVKELIIRHTATSKQGTSLWGVQLSCPVDIRLFVPLASTGDKIAPSPHGRVGIFFLRFSSVAEQDEMYQKLLAGKLYSYS